MHILCTCGPLRILIDFVGYASNATLHYPIEKHKHFVQGSIGSIVGPTNNSLYEALVRTSLMGKLL